MSLIIEDLTKKFDSKVVLNHINFTFEPGRIYGLLGRNGAGKTTFFNCLHGDLDIDSGRFYLEEQGRERPISAKDMGYVISTPAVPEFLTGREFLKFFLDIHKGELDPVLPIDDYFAQMHIDTYDSNKLMKDYSHGMKNKMQLLINLIAQPNLLFLDEPLTSLDVVASEEIKELLRSMKKDRITILSTHIMDLALDLCDEIVLLNHGELELIAKNTLDNEEFRSRILAALKEETDA